MGALEDVPESKKWEEESDARALASAADIYSNPDRLAAAQKAAKRLVKEMDKEAKEDSRKAENMKKLSNSKDLFKESYDQAKMESEAKEDEDKDKE